MTRTALVLTLLLLSVPASAANRSSYPWETPDPVGPKTVFFGEAPRAEDDPKRPLPGDKDYAWYCLEKGSARMLEREYEEAVSFFKAAYAAGGPTRATAGFRLAEALSKAGRMDEAVELLDGMERSVLSGPSEFKEAQKLKMELADIRRKEGGFKNPTAVFTGSDWLPQLSDWRVRYVMDATDVLRKHGIPLNEFAQRYVFLMDEYFTAHPDEAAGDGPVALAAMLYEYDESTRIAIDRWRLDPNIIPSKPATPRFGESKKITGAEWITLVHEDKLDYVAEAMQVLQNQHVPMEKNVYSYVEALDVLFTEKPELPASDSVVALASLLYDTETPAREILEALRLR